MDIDRLKSAYHQLQALDERLAHRLRPGRTFARPGVEQVDERLRDLASYTSELAEILRETILAVGTTPPDPRGAPGAEPDETANPHHQ